MLRNGIRFYIKAKHSQVKFLSLSLNIFIVIYRIRVVGYRNEHIFFLRQLGSIAVLLLWFKTMFWLRLFDTTAQYVSLVSRTLRDITSFMIILIIVLFALGTSLYLLQLNRIYSWTSQKELLLPYNSSDSLFYSTMLYQYYIALGDFGAMNLTEESELG